MHKILVGASGCQGPRWHMRVHTCTNHHPSTHCAELQYSDEHSAEHYLKLYNVQILASYWSFVHDKIASTIMKCVMNVVT